MPDSEDKKLLTDEDITAGLCLSGGGFRAALFHLGALRRLNDIGLLSKIGVISSVSGGSILNGLLASRWERLQKEPTGIFGNFENEIEKPIRSFCRRNLRNLVLIRHRLDPRNWLQLAEPDFSLTNLLAKEYDEGLLNGATMRDVSRILLNGGPRFIFCSTNLATGVNWVFDATRVGDYMVGYTQTPDLKVGMAVAASSAFPIAFPPLTISFGEETRWKGGKIRDKELKRSMRRKASLTDGGVYDNMALEPVWGRNDFVFCSDGGAPFSLDGEPGSGMVSRLKRSHDIIDRQSAALRRRILIAALKRPDYGGCYWGITTDIQNYPLDPKARGYGGRTLQAIAAIRTDLNTFHEEEQLVLMNHGWLLAGAALQAHCREWPVRSSKPPDAVLLDNDLALALLER